MVKFSGDLSYGKIIEQLTRYIKVKFTCHGNITNQLIKTPFLKTLIFFMLDGKVLYEIKLKNGRLDFKILSQCETTLYQSAKLTALEFHCDIQVILQMTIFLKKLFANLRV